MLKQPDARHRLSRRNRSLIDITGAGPHLTLQDAEEVATSLTYELDPHADVIWGARVWPTWKARSVSSPS